MPLPDLLQSGALLSAFGLIDWAAVGEYATKALRSSFENEDGSVNWGKVAATSALAATTIAAGLDSLDEGNRTSSLLEVGSSLLSWWTGSGAGDRKKKGRDRDEVR